MTSLTCTCRPGEESVEGTMQEIIEQRLAPLFGITILDVHALLDLLTDTLDAVLDLPEERRDSDETPRRMAEKSGRTVGWVQNFLTTWEFISDEVDRERFATQKGSQ